MTGVLPCLISPVESEPSASGGRLGDPLLDAYLEFVAARSRPNTVLATWFDLKVFFAVVGKPVGEVRPVDVLGFITAQRAGLSALPDPQLVRARAPEEGGGVSLRTIRRRLSTIGGLYAFLTVRGDVAANRGCQVVCVSEVGHMGLQVGVDAVGVDEGELAQGCFPALDDGAFDELAGGLAGAALG